MADAILPGLSDDICPIEYDACCAEWDVSAATVLLRFYLNKQKTDGSSVNIEARFHVYCARFYQFGQLSPNEIKFHGNLCMIM